MKSKKKTHTSTLDPLTLEGRFTQSSHRDGHPLAFRSRYAEIYHDPATPEQLQLGIIRSCNCEHIAFLCEIGSSAESLTEPDSSLRGEARRQLLYILRTDNYGCLNYTQPLCRFYGALEDHCPRGLQDRETISKVFSYCLLHQGGINPSNPTVHWAERALVWMQQWERLRKHALVGALPELVKLTLAKACTPMRLTFDSKWQDWSMATHIANGDHSTVCQLGGESGRMSAKDRDALKGDIRRIRSPIFQEDLVKYSQESVLTICYLLEKLEHELREARLVK